MADTYPRRFGKYILLSKIASGGMAELLKAKITGDHGFEKVLAIKKIHAHFKTEQDMLSAFIDEARLAALLQHQNIVQVVDFGQVDSEYFIAMEFLDGLDLATVLKMAALAGVTLDIGHALSIAAKVCEGLHYAHSLSDDQGRPLNIVHRDISPANIFITHGGEIKVIDFGIARAASHNRLTVAGSLKGKIRYMAPEQARGSVLDRRADIYAIGALLYEMTAGQPLFKGDGFEILEQVKTGAFAAPEEVIANQGAAFYRLLHKSLATDPAQRYQSCLAMLTDIEACLTELGRHPTNRSLKEVVDALPRLPGSPAAPRVHEATEVCHIFDEQPAPTAPGPTPPATGRRHRLGLVVREYFHAHLPQLVMAAGVLLLLVLAVLSSGRRYTAANLWLTDKNSLYSINYKAGNVLAAGSPVKDLVFDDQAGTIVFSTAEAGPITIHFVPKWHPGLDITAFADTLFTSKKFNALTRGMKKFEVTAIKAGELVEGMDKEAVLVAYGPPPQSATPSLAADQWTYWLNRFTTRTVCFDDSDKLLAACPQPATETAPRRNLGGKIRELFSTN